jgi:hypothetical protein
MQRQDNFWLYAFFGGLFPEVNQALWEKDDVRDAKATTLTTDACIPIPIEIWFGASEHVSVSLREHLVRKADGK